MLNAGIENSHLGLVKWSQTGWLF